MALDAIRGGDETHDQRYQRRGSENRKEDGGAASSHDDHDPGERVIHAFARARARLVMDEGNHLVLLQLVDNGSERVIQEIADRELASANYHGILVDVET